MGSDPIENMSEEALAALAAQGDDDAMSRLIGMITPIARARAAQYAGPRIPGEDLTQEGMIGFVKAVYSFDPAKGVRFRTYAYTLILHEIQTAYQRMVNRKNRPLTDALGIEQEPQKTAAQDPAAITDARMTYEQVHAAAADRLSPFERQVLELRLSEAPRAEIAQALGCDLKAVDNALQRIRKKLRDLF